MNFKTIRGLINVLKNHNGIRNKSTGSNSMHDENTKTDNTLSYSASTTDRTTDIRQQ